MWQWFQSSALLVCLGLIVGCGGGPTASVNYVEGTITLDGAPLSGATVMFSPVDEKSSAGAVGTTDSNGVFKLTDPKGAVNAGAQTGEYVVGVSKVATAAALDPEAWKNDPNYGKEEASHTAPVAPKSEIPVGYNNPKTSGLKASVKSGKNTDIKFELTSSFKPGK